MDDEKQKPIPLKEILAEKKEPPKSQGRIPVPIGVGRGLGYEIKHMHDPHGRWDRKEIDD